MKRGFLKTAEIMIAIIITMIFFLTVMPENVINKQNRAPDILESLKYNQEFRAFVIATAGCGPSDHVRHYLPDRYQYTLCINEIPASLPRTRVQVQSMFYAGNSSQLEYKDVRLYVWME